MAVQGSIRASKGYAIFRIVFGLIFIGLGVDQLSRPATTSHVGYFTLGIGALFVGYGFVTLLTPKVLGTKLELDAPTATERLAEITQLRTNGLISEEEFEVKRQEILKDL